MPFEKGQSGNPAGRPRGSRNRAAILFENLLEGDSEAIARKAIELAKEGDIAAIRICLDRLPRPARSIRLFSSFRRLPRPRTRWRRRRGSWPPSPPASWRRTEAADLAKVIDIYVRALATTAFEERLAKLEAVNATQQRQAEVPT
jgi:hypothetical protein